MEPATEAAERLSRLAASDRYQGPQSEGEAEMIRNWVLHGQRVLDREVAR